MDSHIHTTNLRKVGGSVMLAVPPAILDVLQRQAGATVGVSVESGRLVVEPHRRPRDTRDDLLAQCDGPAEMTPEEQEWVGAGPAGKELL